MKQAVKILRNVFVSHKGNTLQLANIHFDQKIRQVEFLLPEAVNWAELETKEARARFLRRLRSRLRPVKSGEIDGAFLLLMPGAVDAHVHFDTPGFEFREDFEHASSAALWGGVTTIIDMPCTSIPPVTSLENLQIKLSALQNRAFCDFALWGGISGADFKNARQLEQHIADLVQAGVVGFKAYLLSGMESFADLLPEQMEQAALWCKQQRVPLAVHAEDKQMVLQRREQLQKQGRSDWRAYCQARDIAAEEKAVKFLAALVQKTGASIHVVHLSSAKGLAVIRRAQEEGWPLSGETCPHYLFFTQNAFERPEIRNFLKTAPPVKFEADRQALWQGVADGSLRFITTDHAGCDPQKEKSDTNFWRVYGGIPGVEHRVPFVLSEGFLKNRLTLERSIQVLASEPAAYFKLSEKGTLQTGKDADFALVDLWQKWVVRAEDMHSKGKYTPFEGVTFGARVMTTYLRGQRVVDFKTRFQEALPLGRFVSRSLS